MALGSTAVSTKWLRSAGAVGGDFGQPQAAGRVSVPELDGADDQHLAVVAAPARGAGGIALGAKRGGWPRRFRPDPTTDCAQARPSPDAACGRAARRCVRTRCRAVSGVAGLRCRWNGSPSGRRPRTRSTRSSPTSRAGHEASTTGCAASICRPTSTSSSSCFNRRKSRHAAFRSLFALAVKAKPKPTNYNMLIKPELTA